MALCAPTDATTPHVPPKPSSTTLADTLRAGVSQLELHLSPTQHAQLLGYIALLARWNRVYNLTAVRDPADMLVQHILDSLAILPHMPAQAATPSRVLDVGSGGGLPGVVLAIMHPNMEVHCVDAVAKKCAFIRQAAQELELPRLQARHARVETLRPPPDYDLITSRAFASLSDFTRLTGHLLAHGGCWLALKGQRPDDELAALPSTVAVFHVEQIQVPFLQAERHLVWMRPQPPGA